MTYFDKEFDAHFSDLLRKLGRSLNAKLICDSDGHILYQNEVSQGLLSAHDGLVGINGRLSSIYDNDARNLRRAISDVIDTAAEVLSYVVVTLNRPFEGGFLEVLVEPVVTPSQWGRQDSPDRTLAIVTVALRPNSVTARNDVLHDLYDLTEAEARVVNSLVNCQSLIQIAEELEVSKNTIRSQLQSIFSKTHTRRQSELVNLILTGIAVEPNFVAE